MNDLWEGESPLGSTLWGREMLVVVLLLLLILLLLLLLLLLVVAGRGGGWELHEPRYPPFPTGGVSGLSRQAAGLRLLRPRLGSIQPAQPPGSQQPSAGQLKRSAD